MKHCFKFWFGNHVDLEKSIILGTLKSKYITIYISKFCTYFSISLLCKHKIKLLLHSRKYIFCKLSCPSIKISPICTVMGLGYIFLLNFKTLCWFHAIFRAIKALLKIINPLLLFQVLNRHFLAQLVRTSTVKQLVVRNI